MQELTNRLDKAMTQEQFTQVVDAILDGKYSWACVLILRFAGYNPLHYIPYRTYNRLMKENGKPRQQSRSQRNENDHQQQTETLTLQDCLDRLGNLGYLEALDEEPEKIRGGSGNHFLHHALNLFLTKH